MPEQSEHPNGKRLPASSRLTAGQVRAGRILAGMTVRRLASAAGISTNTVCAYESGETQAPRLDTAERIRHALEAAGIDLHPGGWVRQRAEAALASKPRTRTRPIRERVHANIYELQRLIESATFPDDSPARKARDQARARRRRQKK